MEDAQLGSPIVDPGLGLLGPPEVVPNNGPHLSHAVLYVLHVVQRGAMG